MKRTYLLLFIALVAIISCQKEINFDNAGGDGGGTGGSGNCKACSYLPMCDGSIFNYYDTTIGGTPTVTADTLQFIKDTTFSGRSNQKFITKGFPTQPYFTNCTNGVSRYTLFNVAATGGTVTKIELRMLDANLAVNGTWNDTIQNGFGQTVIYKNVIKEKGITRTLHSNTFTDVIHVQADAGVEVPFLGFLVTNRSDYYYAKNVGLIEANVANEDGSVVYEHKVIKAYRIP